MDLSAYDFDLPESFIALRPCSPRDASRLLVVRGDGSLEDRHFHDLPDLLTSKDLLVANDTRVLPAHLRGVRLARDETSVAIDIQVNLADEVSPGIWRALARPGKRLRSGDRLSFTESLNAILHEKGEDGVVFIDFGLPRDALLPRLEQVGAMPIPPYIMRQRDVDEQDSADYQTLFAQPEKTGSAAAPTAGLHMTDRVRGRLAERGTGLASVTLHVGLGTFAPLKPGNLEENRLHAEYFEVTAAAAEAIRERNPSGRVIPIGTTALRTLEAWVRQSPSRAPMAGETDIFLKPGDEFELVSGLLTNFHLPKSSLFMLVCALMGTEVMQAAYRHAISSGYRFYSYGDACLLLPGNG